MQEEYVLESNLRALQKHVVGGRWSHFFFYETSKQGAKNYTNCHSAAMVCANDCKNFFVIFGS